MARCAQRTDHSRTESAFPRRALERHQGFVGSEWDPIFERDTEGLLVKRMGDWWTANTRSWWFLPELMFASISSAAIR